MPTDIYNLLVMSVVALFIIWLIYRTEHRIKLTVKNEIYNNFPSIKHAIGNFEQRIDYLKTRIETLNNRINELEKRTNK